MVWLSYTGFETYKRCSEQYRLYYKEKLRPKQIGSALHFGNALDEAYNLLLLSKKKKLTKEENDSLNVGLGFPVSPYNYEVWDEDITKRKIRENVSPELFLFEENFYKLKIENKGEAEWQTAPTSLFLDYYKSDFQEEILEEDDLEKLKSYIENAGYWDEDEAKEPNPLELFYEIQNDLDNGKVENLTDQSYYNYCCWLSLRRKGLLFIESYKRDILPKIKETVSVQKKVRLPNDSDDMYVGILDAEIIFEGDEKIYTTDNKTSSPSTKYKQSDINVKHQIPGYDEFADNGYGAYIVQYKKIKTVKKCEKCGTIATRSNAKNCLNKDCGSKLPEKTQLYVDFDILKDKILDKTKDDFFWKFDEVLGKIKKGVFHQNRDECFQFGRKCPYYFYCRSKPQARDVNTIKLIKK